MTRCPACHTEITWATTEHGRKMAVDTAITHDGNIKLTVDPRDPATIACRQLGGQELDDARTLGTELHHAHKATCPREAARRRRERRSRTANR